MLVVKRNVRLASDINQAFVLCFIFTTAGGAASKNGTLRVGDQILSVNGRDVTVLSRIEAWNLMKKLPDGAVQLVIRHKLII